MISFNCETGNHGGCNQFHNGCSCEHHPAGRHLSAIGRWDFIDVDTYPSATVEELKTHLFHGQSIQKNYILSGSHEQKKSSKPE